jgi:hypothetical protein
VLLLNHAPKPVWPAVLIAVSIALLIAAAGLITTTDPGSFWLNLESETIGLLIGGFVIAFLTERLLERSFARRWLAVRSSVLWTLRIATVQVAHVARMNLRGGLRLEPLEEDRPLPAVMRTFAGQLAASAFDKYKWRFPLEDMRTPYQADEAYVAATKRVLRVALRILPSARSYLPAAASAGDERLVEIISKLTEFEFSFGYLSDRMVDGENPVALGEALQKQLVEFLIVSADLCQLADEALGSYPFDLVVGEKEYEQELSEREQWGIED